MTRFSSATIHRGMTLIEALVVSAVLSLLVVVIGASLVQFYQSNEYTLAQAAEVDSARRGIEFAVRDIREMSFADDGSYPLVSASSTEISFFSDIDRDDSVELVRYSLSSTTLFKYITNATGTPPGYVGGDQETITISDSVRNIDQGTSTFRYFDINGSEVDGSSVTDVAFVAVTLIVNVNPFRNPGEFTLRSSAAIRNVINNI